MAHIHHCVTGGVRDGLSENCGHCKAAKINTDRDPLLVEREKTHGSFKDNANAWMDIRETLRKHARPSTNNQQNLALEMIALKLARLCQTPHVKDHWDDIAGYAKLGAEACDDR